MTQVQKNRKVAVFAAVLSVSGSFAALAQTPVSDQAAAPPPASALAAPGSSAAAPAAAKAVATPAPGTPAASAATPATPAASATPTTAPATAPAAAAMATAPAPATAGTPAAPAAPAAAASNMTTPAKADGAVSGTVSGSVTAPAVTPGATGPSAAEMAIVQNATVLGTLTPIQPVAGGLAQGQGMKVTDILGQPATIRPLPEKYLIVRKDHDAGDPSSQLTSARVALWQGHYQAALELFDDLYKKDSRDIRVAMGRAVALQKLGQTDEALSAYQSALSMDPKNVEALTNMLGLIKGQDTATALARLKQLRDMYPANADIAAQLGMVYGVSGDYDNAVKYLDMADALKPGSAVVLYNKAIAYDRMGRTMEAADMYRKIVLMESQGTLDQHFPVDAVRKRLAVLR